MLDTQYYYLRQLKTGNVKLTYHNFISFKIHFGMLIQVHEIPYLSNRNSSIYVIAMTMNDNENILFDYNIQIYITDLQ